MDSERWRRVSRIAADCLELEPAARGAYLERTCAGDSELRAEVERIVLASAGADRLLDFTATTLDGLGTPGSASDPGERAPEPHRASVAEGARATGRLPAELLDRAARRIGALSLLYATGFALAYTLRELTLHAIGGSPYVQSVHTPGQVVTLVFVLLGLAMAWIARRRTLPAEQLISSGLAFEVIGGFGIALVSYSGTWREGSVWGVSWLCVWILFFPFVVPAPPRAAAWAAFATAATALLAVGAWAATRGFVWPRAVPLLAATLPNFVAAVLASIGARTVYRIGVERSASRRLGSYRLVAPLGKGGMGEVWIAEHDLIVRPAALKLIRPELLGGGRASAEAIDRFEREAQSTATLSSPHTVRLYDFGLTGDGLFYYVMELLDGRDLESLIRRDGPVPPARAIHFLRQACDSLAEAHAMGLVHRDIKPSNLFACRQGLEHDFLKVLDFGIVRPSGPPGSNLSGTMGSSALEGTPAFMAPEAALGHASPASDLYAIGCVGYWLLTGRPVFEADRIDVLLQRHLEEVPMPPSVRSGREIPAPLEDAILRCLEKDPALRPADAEELGAVLGALPVPAWTQKQARACWGLAGSHEVPV